MRAVRLPSSRSPGTGAAFLRHIGLQFERDRCTQIAAALAFTSLLALVPLLAVVFSALSLFPAFGAWHGSLENFIFENFVPASGKQVQAYLAEFTAKATGLQAAGIAFLIVTVLSMMSTIESTFNAIWRVQRRRPRALRFLVYWATLTLGPLLIGAGMVATSYLVSLPVLQKTVAIGSLNSVALRVLPFITTFLAFVLFYKLIPYRPVAFAHALAGAFTASVLFEFAKRLFALYVTNFPAQEAVYGTFATLPIFLLWVYLSWVIVLYGAEFTHGLSTFDAVRSGRRGTWLRSPLYCGYRILLQLHEAQRRGATLSDEALRAREPLLDHEITASTLMIFDEARWISRDDRYHWLLVRDLSGLSFADLMALLPFGAKLEPGADFELDEADARLLELLRAHAQQIETEFSVPLTVLLAPPT